uniref:F-box domain-containing protein n=1 Tax=Aegilops tauschii TaxID=37682 RepID=M8B1T5_AEGTA
MALAAASQLLVPDDILACVLRGLAASRCVCKSWRTVIDDRRLLRADFLPLSLHGIFFMEQLNPTPPKFFGSALIQRKIAAKLDYLDTDLFGHLSIKDHCNGLLLLWDQLVGEVTEVDQAITEWRGNTSYFGPQRIRPSGKLSTTIFTKESAWPPSPYAVRVFSSRTWQWEEKLLVRRGEAAGTIADMQSDWQPEHRYTVYWQGALYVHCQDDSIMRITLYHGEYEVIKSPTGSKTKRADLYLGKSKKGVYCALVSNCRSYRLRVWLLTEVCGKMKWGVKIDISLLPVVAKFSWISRVENSGPWILHEGNCNRDGEKAPVEDKLEWDFDKATVLEGVDNAESEYMHGDIYFLGIHPYKEIAFLWISRTRVVAYHLCSSNVQDLGELRLQSVGDSFPYTPCWTGEL